MLYGVASVESKFNQNVSFVFVIFISIIISSNIISIIIINNIVISITAGISNIIIIYIYIASPGEWTVLPAQCMGLLKSKYIICHAMANLGTLQWLSGEVFNPKSRSSGHGR